MNNILEVQDTNIPKAGSSLFDSAPQLPNSVSLGTEDQKFRTGVFCANHGIVRATCLPIPVHQAAFLLHPLVLFGVDSLKDLEGKITLTES